MTRAAEIHIRHAEPDDYPAVHTIYAQSSVIWGTLQLPLPSKERWRKRLAEPAEGFYNLVAVVDDQIVGQLGLHTAPNYPRRQHVGQLGMGVHEAWQGQGVGRVLMQAAIDLADKWLNLRRLELEVYTDNTRAIALYKRFDFETEGLKRDFAFRDGMYVDAYAMARIKPSL